jgi:hypothetical protein
VGLLILVLLVLLVAGSVPAYPYSRTWGYYPSGTFGLLFLVLLALLLSGAVPWGWWVPAGPPPVILR